VKPILLIFFISLSLAANAQQDSLIWSDEFNESGAPDPTYWSYDIGASGWGNNEIQNYSNSLQNSWQANGSLFIKALKSGNSWTSARIITSNKFNFTYGKVVYRAKLPTGSGTWPALWMLGQNFSTVDWPACGEVDVMEHVGKNPGIVHGSIHTPSSYGNTVNTNTINVPTFSTEFHLYEVKWFPDRIEFRVDSTLYYTYKPSVRNASTWPFNKPCFLIMNIAMGGNFGSDPQYETNGLKNGIDPSLYYAVMELDYVRVYKLTNPASIEEPRNKNNQKSSGQLNFSPNPANGKIHLQLPAGDKITGTFYDMAGKDVFHFQSIGEPRDIDISSLCKGVYFISTESEGRITTNKLIVN
jgi:beta-glucanase (GH16 family)